MNLDGQHPERGSLDAWGTLCGARGARPRRCGSARWSRRPRSATRRCSPSSSTTADHISRRAGRARPRRRLARARARGLRLPVRRRRRSGWTCSRSSSRSCSATGATSRSRSTGAHYTLARPRRPAQARPAPAPAADHRRQRRPAQRRARRAVRRRVQHAVRDGRRVRDAARAVLAACEKAGREPMPFSIMTGVIVGRDDAELRERVGRLAAVTGPGRRRAAVRAAAGLDHRHARRGDRAAAGAARGRRQPRDVPAAAARRPRRGRAAGR